MVRELAHDRSHLMHSGRVPAITSTAVAARSIPGRDARSTCSCAEAMMLPTRFPPADDAKLISLSWIGNKTGARCVPGRGNEVRRSGISPSTVTGCIDRNKSFGPGCDFRGSTVCGAPKRVIAART